MAKTLVTDRKRTLIAQCVNATNLGSHFLLQRWKLNDFLSSLEEVGEGEVISSGPWFNRSTHRHPVEDCVSKDTALGVGSLV